jgi:hypothetical protein
MAWRVPTSLTTDTVIPCFSKEHLSAHDWNGRAVVIPQLGVSVWESGSGWAPT